MASIPVDSVKSVIRTVPASFVRPFITSAKGDISVNSSLLKNTFKYCDPDKYAAIVTDNGEVTYSYNATKSVVPASLAKLATLFMTFKEMKYGNLKPDDRLKIDSMDMREGIRRLKIVPQDYFTARNGIYGTYLASAADAADALARKQAGSIANFMTVTNDEMKLIGMKNTQLMDPAGVPHPEARTTAEDMAILTQALPECFPEYCATALTKEEYIVHLENSKKDIPSGNYKMTSHAIVKGKIGSLNVKSDMGKTGDTDASGLNIFSSFAVNGHRYNIIVFGGRTKHSRAQHVLDLLEEAMRITSERDQTGKIASVRQVGELKAMPPERDIREISPFPPSSVQWKLEDWKKNMGMPDDVFNVQALYSSRSILQMPTAP